MQEAFRKEPLKRMTAVRTVLHLASLLQSMREWMRKHRDLSSWAARANGQAIPRPRLSRRSERSLPKRKRTRNLHTMTQHRRSLIQQPVEVGSRESLGGKRISCMWP